MSQGLPISELMKLIKRASCESEFNAVQNMLMDREKNAKIEIENLRRDRDSLKEEVLLLERTQCLARFEKSKTEEKLQRARSKFEEMKDIIARLKNKNSESQEKLKCSDTNLVKMGKEIEDLRREKSASDKTVEELRRKKLEADKGVEELKRQNDELRQKNVESDKAAEIYKIQLEKLVPRIMKVEQELAGMLKVKVDDLGNVVEAMEKSTEHGCIGLSKKGEGNLVQVLTKEDCSNAFQNSPSSRSGFDLPQAQNNVTDQEHEHNRPKGSDIGRKELDGSDPHASKMAPPSSPIGDIIEIPDGDDKTNPNGAASNTDIIVASNAGEKEMILDKSDRNPPSSPTKKRSRTDSKDDPLMNTSTKRERSISERNPNNLPSGLLNDEDSTDSGDESCSDSYMENLIAELRSKMTR